MKKHAKLALIATVPLFLASCNWFKKVEEKPVDHTQTAGETAAEKAVEKAAESIPVATLQTTPDGLQIEVIQAASATATEAQAGRDITVKYVGWMEKEGKKEIFDSTEKHGRDFTFTLGKGNVIKGWDQGLQGMKVGEKRKLVVPPALAYGPNGAGNVIPGNATLNFEVELVKVA